MYERVSDYVKTLTQKDTTGYELAARVCATYFDERGIDTPTAEDWEAFERDYPLQYQREKGKELSASTLQHSYVPRGKAFYRWCEKQDGGLNQTPNLFPEEAQTQAEEASPAHVVKEEKQSSPPKSEGDKSTTRISLLLDTDIYRVLAVLSALEDKTMTAILTEGARLYIREHPREAAIARGAIEQVKDKGTW